jgi:hypothetical protein
MGAAADQMIKIVTDAEKAVSDIPYSDKMEWSEWMHTQKVNGLKLMLLNPLGALQAKELAGKYEPSRSSEGRARDVLAELEELMHVVSDSSKEADARWRAAEMIRSIAEAVAFSK